uniref:Retrotransposon gag domain-containing protein n=1 Tax=Chromera velia CCMP2878 TaxID=1169474 RepID=A0A0G4IF62_9ALVE|eukprot:Cvel_13953.t1-p1 / transcript=Cvel_13953.t1 / gene=Cvel_13953 / organism=Chromera_velia_CCMP2878 / gene_product=hypothetical protein / transcript_product=hypothetical protein / location=Cvel_scaffold974:30247-32376(-) / protein_length=505 / sequence_SO=supercontig / SO=protein_coding / is_pseudo=false
MEDCLCPSEDFVPGGEVGVPLPRAVTVNKPNIFDGKRKHLTSWIRKVKRYFKLTRTPVQRQLDLAINYLNDVEQNYIEDLEEKQGIVVNTLNDLFVALRKKFINPKEQEILRKELYAVKFSPSKGIETYSVDFLHAAAQLTEMTTAELLFHYKKSLPAKVQQEVSKAKPKTLQEAAIEAACLAEGMEEDGVIHKGESHPNPVAYKEKGKGEGNGGDVDMTDAPEASKRMQRSSEGGWKGSVLSGDRVYSSTQAEHSGLEEEMKFTLAELDNEYDIFFGMKWLEAHNPQIDWKEKSVTFPYRGQLLTLWGTGGEDPYGRLVPPPISARGTERAIRGGTIVHIFRLAPRLLPSDPCIFSEEQCLFSEEQQETDFDELEERLIERAFENYHSLFMACRDLNKAFLQAPVESVPEGVNSHTAAEENNYRAYEKVMKDLSLHPAARRVLSQFRDVFPNKIPELPPKRSVKFTIDLEPGHALPARPPYRLSYGELDEMRRQLDDYLKKGFI